ncbi:MAG: translation initiation factor IF-3 [Xanthomonadales bacterium]|uniref:translation initiation factor IF-3 n=1 Tax=Hydrogenophaga sp. TaxID=1904254 RepID=UPI0016BB2BA5|nr:translation initiation factor IF-3 [Hydrogenophaga sp.]NIM70544.1 translation initiation factor IF-3 [Xanthomonadales bacterium]NIN32866.1 translation initiation factor IF-3 [Hydrogenophaga sp.]NIN59919.1 translation initiation factor IF-3 [Xanthomonadales bacterium]NIN75293.1 translation initiation factor IF-3 [Xanthomonadales bacterium]NIO12499.1 translation initiation factor IF-3 [Xanthomonadales bacterium]
MAANKETRRNEDIFAPQVRVISPDGEQAGVMPLEEAQGMADEVGLDLVEIAPNAEPPVCRIMDYGKYRFEQSKKAQAARKKQKVTHVKEVKFRPGTDEADYQVKMRNVRRFIEDGDKVKITLRFRGREMAHQELGTAMLTRIRDSLAEEVVVEQWPKMEGRQMVMLVSPKRV